MTSPVIRAAEALGDRLVHVPRQPVFFDEAAREAIAGKPDGEALDILARMIDDAEHHKQQGSGPPLDAINKVRRLWLHIYARHYGRIA